VLWKGMKKPLSAALLVLMLVVGGPCFAQQETCPDCKPSVPATDREMIRAARAKFDAEMKADTKRPWDGMNLRNPNASADRGPASDARK